MLCLNMWGVVENLLFQVIMAIKDFFNAVIEYETPRYVKVSGSDIAF